MTFDSWVIFFLIALVPAISPGPAIFLTIKNAIKHGPLKTFYSATGNACGLVILGYAVSFGLGALMDSSIILFNVIKYLGAAYLIYLGVKVWRDESLGRSPAHVQSEQTPNYRLFFEGLLISLTNPKAIAILAAIFPSFLTNPDQLVLQASILSFTYALLCYCNHIVLIMFAKKIQRKMNTPKNLIALRRVLGCTFVSFGVALGAVSRS